MIFHYRPSNSLIHMTQYTVAPVLVLLISCSTLLQHCQPYLYVTTHYCCPSTSPINTTQDTTAQSPVLLILIYNSNYWPSTSYEDTTQSTTAPVPVLLIPYSPPLPQYQTSPFDTLVHYCPGTSPFDTLQYTTVLVSDLSIQHIQLLPSTSY